MWFTAAFLSAFFSASSSVIAKYGVKKMDSDISTAIRTGVVCLIAWATAFATGSVSSIINVSARTWIFLILSGLTNGFSWLCYYRALLGGPVDIVMPIEKSSAAVTIPIAVFLFHETDNAPIRIFCAAVLCVGIFCLADKSKDIKMYGGKGWLVFALLALFFSSANSIISKYGIDGVESNLGTAITITVILPISWMFVVGRGKMPETKHLQKREILFTILSGMSTGVCWLLYYYAVKEGLVSVAIALNKLAIPVGAVLSAVFLHEYPSKRTLAGLLLISWGIMIIACFT